MPRRQRTKKGISLAKGPVGLVGLVLLAYGITALIFGGHSFAQHAPTGAVHGKTWLGLEVNGWSGLLFIAVGVLLMLGAPLHWGAKGMSLLVGIVLVAACLIALANRHGAVGLFAANHLTELVWAAAGALLIVLSLLPRVGGRTSRRQDPDPAERRLARRRVETERRIVERDPAEPTRGVERQGSPADGTLALTSARSMTTPAAATTVQNRKTTTASDWANARQSPAPGVQPAAATTTPPSTQTPGWINHD
ncbi:MAG: hypothetical protein ACLP8S_14935 [Solirubrobacteraceae bacterium]